MAAFKATVDVNGTLAALSTYCNRDFGTIDATVTQMETIVNSLLTAVNQTLDLVACQRIVPIYDQAMYDGACEYSVMAVFWVFSSALIMGTFGLLMILFRAAYKPTISDHVSLHEIVNKVDVDDSEELFERVNLDDDVVSEESPRHLDNSGHHY